MGVPKKDIQRLDKFLSTQLGITRSEAKELIKRRVVTVGGVTAKLFDMKIDPEKDAVCSEGKEVTYRKHIYIMMNKPQGAERTQRNIRKSNCKAIHNQSIIPTNL